MANLYFFYHYDIWGSVTAIVRPDGTLMEGYTYDEFGNLSETGEAFNNEVTYTGSVTDTSTGLQYMNARYYNPTTGRFLSQDTYTGNAYEPWTQHLYSYCGNNPTNFVDPTGHFADEALGVQGYSKYRVLTPEEKRRFIEDDKSELMQYKQTLINCPNNLHSNYAVITDWEEYVNLDYPPNNEFDRNVNKEFLQRLAYMAYDLGLILDVGSGYRTYHEQKDAYENGTGKAARPGTSWHEFGLAVDVRSMRFFEKLPRYTIDENGTKVDTLAQYGLCRPATYTITHEDGTKTKGWEWWHIQPIETLDYDGPASGRKDWAYSNAYFTGIDKGWE